VKSEETPSDFPFLYGGGNQKANDEMANGEMVNGKW
jgi:hypothetical protein